MTGHALVPDVSHLVLAHYIFPAKDSAEVRYVPMRVFLDWSRERPFAVLCTFQDQRGPKEWLISRELLAEGLYAPTGVGDVSLFPSLEQLGSVELVLDSPSGRCGVLFTRLALYRFLKETYELVPAGSESMPDAWFEELIGS